ncbi:MAG: flagellar hook-basal body complex protein FliE [Alphaproteobacteria bacterium]|nr:flagellar hook-basal body complex protein FliE [Alphaproteobacteria bacterium]
MVMTIPNVLSAYNAASKAGQGASAASSQGASFMDSLKGFMNDAAESVRTSENLAAQSTVGKADLQEVILAVSNAEIMMQTITTIRDKVITAYQEILRTAI